MFVVPLASPAYWYANGSGSLSEKVADYNTGFIECEPYLIWEIRGMSELLREWMLNSLLSQYSVVYSYAIFKLTHIIEVS